MLAALNPEVARVIALDPNPWLALIQYKFNRLPESHQLVRASDKFPIVRENTSRLVGDSNLQDSGNVFPVFATGKRLPFQENTVDRIHMVQVMHWLAFAEDDEMGKDITHFKGVLLELKRVLKPGGVLIFDETGLQFKFSEDELNVSHIYNYPWYLACERELFSLLYTNGYLESDYSLGMRPKVNKYHHMFTEPKLATFFNETGFEMVTFDELPAPTKKYNYELRLSNSRKYITFSSPQDIQAITDQFLQGGVMTYFSSDTLSEIPSDVKTELLRQAVFKAQAKPETQVLRERPASQTFAYFAAKKR